MVYSRQAAMLYEKKYRIESARLQGWDYRSRGWYFVTICTHHRQPIFGQIAGNQIRSTALG
jgi:putative transposase